MAKKQTSTNTWGFLQPTLIDWDNHPYLARMMDHMKRVDETHSERLWLAFGMWKDLATQLVSKPLAYLRKTGKGNEVTALIRSLSAIARSYGGKGGIPIPVELSESCDHLESTAGLLDEIILQRYSKDLIAPYTQAADRARIAVARAYHAIESRAMDLGERPEKPKIEIPEKAEAAEDGIVRVTATESEILGMLAKRQGTLQPQKLIARHTDKAIGTIKGYCPRLERKGLIRRPSGDKMGYELTPQGLKVYEKTKDNSPQP
jgi:DNA-binding MarR family transcriptional regulator